MTRTSSSRRTGRIQIHHREVDDGAAIIGGDLDLGEHFAEDLQGTLRLEMSDATRHNYRRRLLRIIHYLKSNFPTYYEQGVVQVSEVDLQDPSKYYFNKYKVDLEYTGLNVQMILSFMLFIKAKGDGKIKGINDIRKYKDAILWGAKTAAASLPLVLLPVLLQVPLLPVLLPVPLLPVLLPVPLLPVVVVLAVCSPVPTPTACSVAWQIPPINARSAGSTSMLLAGKKRMR